MQLNREDIAWQDHDAGTVETEVKRQQPVEVDECNWVRQRAQAYEGVDARLAQIAKRLVREGRAGMAEKDMFRELKLLANPDPPAR